MLRAGPTFLIATTRNARLVHANPGRQATPRYPHTGGSRAGPHPLSKGLLQFTMPLLEAARSVFLDSSLAYEKKETTMAWTTPTLVEICIGLEINGYLPAEF